MTGPIVAPEAALTPKGRATRARIVAAASDLMYRHGVAGTTTEDVRGAAGVSNSQLYHYFDDKSALVRAVISHQTERVLSGQEALLAELDSVVALQGWRDHVVAAQRRSGCVGGCPIGSLSSELADTDEGARAALAGAFSRWQSAIRRGLQAMQRRGELTADADPERLALATLAALQGGLLLAQAQRDVEPLEAALDAALAHVRALSVEPAVPSGR